MVYYVKGGKKHMLLGPKVVPKVESRDTSPLGVASLGGKGGSYTEPYLHHSAFLPPRHTWPWLLAGLPRGHVTARIRPDTPGHKRQEFSWNSASSHRWPGTLQGWPESTGGQGAVTAEGPWAGTPMTKAEPQRATPLDTSAEAPPSLFLLKQGTAR